MSREISVATASVVVCLVLSAVSCGTIARMTRSIGEPSTTTDMDKVKYCSRSTPCGWAIYVPFTREVNHFMTNTCTCPDGTACLRSDDDLSVSAYVHRCREKTVEGVREPDADLQNVST